MTMDIIDKRIYSCNEAICKNIESLQANERGFKGGKTKCDK